MILILSLSSLGCQDLHGAIKRVSSFLQCPLVEDELNNCVKHSSFSSMKENKMINYTLVPEEIMDHSKGSFMRTGRTRLIDPNSCHENWNLLSIQKWLFYCSGSQPGGRDLLRGPKMNLRSHKRIKEIFSHLFRPLQILQWNNQRQKNLFFDKLLTLTCEEGSKTHIDSFEGVMNHKKFLILSEALTNKRNSLTIWEMCFSPLFNIMFISWEKQNCFVLQLYV